MAHPRKPGDGVCFDRIFPKDLLAKQPPPGGAVSAAFFISKLWRNGSVLRIRFLDGTPEQRQFVRTHAVEWTKHANLKFEFNDNALDAEIRISFTREGAWSTIGTDAYNVPWNEPTMNFGWLDDDGGVVRHEFGHAIGMIHEHQNPVDNKIVWNKAVVNAALSAPPNNWPQQVIDQNMYEKYDQSQLNASTFDKDSIMLYAFPPGWTTNGFHTERNAKLSNNDKQFAARSYPGATGIDTSGVQKVVQLPVFTAVKAAIGEPGEEDMYEFTVSEAGAYTVETTGSTDLVMTIYGFGGVPFAQDDNSADGRNPRIIAVLQPGIYQVQVRHYNTARGTGEYGIRVFH